MKAPYKIVFIYIIFGILWITLSDQITFLLVDSHHIETLTHFQTYKGIFYIISTALLLFVLIKRYERKTNKIISELKSLNHEVIVKSEEIKRSWKLFSDSFELSPFPMWIVNWENLHFLKVNKAAEDHYGYSKSEFKSKTLLDIRPDEEQAKFLNFIQTEKEKNSTSFNGIFKHYDKNKELIIVDSRVTKVDYFGIDARLVIANDITELLDIQHSLKKAYDSVIDIEEFERERIAGELHDGLIQYIVAAKQFASIISDQTTNSELEKFTVILTETLDKSLLECRRMIHDLRPKELKSEGLESAIENTINDLNLIGKYKINVKISLDHQNQLSELLKFTIFRIFQENLNNMIKHSCGNEGNLEIIQQESEIHYCFWDNGKGFTEADHLNESSFISLKRRLKSIGGTFSVNGNPKKGAIFTFIIPISIESSSFS